MIAIHACPLVLGERILLKIQPVDPRDLFRGDFVILSYDISRIPEEGIEGIPYTADWSRWGWSRDEWTRGTDRLRDARTGCRAQVLARSEGQRDSPGPKGSTSKASMHGAAGPSSLASKLITCRRAKGGSLNRSATPGGFRPK